MLILSIILILAFSLFVSSLYLHNESLKYNGCENIEVIYNKNCDISNIHFLGILIPFITIFFTFRPLMNSLAYFVDNIRNQMREKNG
jgi:hypothetical protein